MAAKQKNSLVANINRRKRAGKSRPKKRSTVSSESYKEMRAGWPHSKKAKRKSTARRKTAKRKSATRKTSARKKS
jgi:hypothetical protein